MTDDLDGGSADETVWFGLGDEQYEVDLSASHADDLRQAIAPFTTAGPGSPARSPRSRG
jgi:hypothetical protein